jgi:hypothetical protein
MPAGNGLAVLLALEPLGKFFRTFDAQDLVAILAFPIGNRVVDRFEFDIVATCFGATSVSIFALLTADASGRPPPSATAHPRLRRRSSEPSRANENRPLRRPRAFFFRSGVISGHWSLGKRLIARRVVRQSSGSLPCDMADRHGQVCRFEPAGPERNAGSELPVFFGAKRPRRARFLGGRGKKPGSDVFERAGRAIGHCARSRGMDPAMTT